MSIIFKYIRGGFLAIEKYGYSDDDHGINYKNNNKIIKIMKHAIDRGPYNEHRIWSPEHVFSVFDNFIYICTHVSSLYRSN